jgi:hypothetical protein
MKSHNMSLAWSRVFQLLLFMALSGMCFESQATDDYYDYISDLRLHESHQVHNPKLIIKYTDDDMGKLLRSLLDLSRFNSVWDKYNLSIKRGEKRLEIAPLLDPLLRRYETAFIDHPKDYEAEYLDVLEITAVVLTSGLATVKKVNAEKILNKSVSKTTSERNSLDALAETVIALNKMLVNLKATVDRAMATSIREKVERNMFSEMGAKRALGIADKINPR